MGPLKPAVVLGLKCFMTLIMKLLGYAFDFLITCVYGGGDELGVKMIDQNPGRKVKNTYFDIQ